VESESQSSFVRKVGELQLRSGDREGTEKKKKKKGARALAGRRYLLFPPTDQNGGRGEPSSPRAGGRGKKGGESL